MNEMQKVFIKKNESNKTANKTTFYRTMKLFKEKDIVHQIDDGTAVTKFTISDENPITIADSETPEISVNSFVDYLDSLK